MIYLQTKTILVMITVLHQENNKLAYLVGDTIYENLPSQILSNAFIGANWNRAVKYGLNIVLDQKVAEQLKNFSKTHELKVGYYKMSFDFYFDEVTQKLMTLPKTSFDQQILQQKNFPNFLNYLIKQMNLYKPESSYSLLIPQDLWSTQLISFDWKNHLPITNMSHFVINADFKVADYKAKWKYLVQAGTETKITITKHNQLLYTYDVNKVKDLSFNFSYFSLVNNMVYLQGQLISQNQNPIHLTALYEDQKKVLAMKAMILNQFAELIIDENEKNLHFFNITGDEQYLTKILLSYNKTGYLTLLNKLNQLFDLTKSNHYPVIYAQPALRDLLLKNVNSLNELNDFVHQSTRFGVLNKTELSMVEAIRQKLT